MHAILATHPLKRLRHAGRVFVAGAEDPAVPRHLGFIPTATVEEAIAEAERIHLGTMITRTLPYGDTTFEVSLPDRTRSPSRDLRGGLQPVADQAEAVLTALAKPLRLPHIREMVRPGGRVLIAFDNPTAPSYGPVRRLVIEAVIKN